MVTVRVSHGQPVRVASADPRSCEAPDHLLFDCQVLLRLDRQLAPPMHSLQWLFSLAASFSVAMGHSGYVGNHPFSQRGFERVGTSRPSPGASKAPICIRRGGGALRRDPSFRTASPYTQKPQAVGPRGFVCAAFSVLVASDSARPTVVPNPRMRCKARDEVSLG